MNACSRQLEEAIRAVVFHSDTSYSWLGRQLPPIARSVKQRITPEDARAYLIYNLRNQLYADFYCAGLPRRRETIEARVQPGLTPFVQALSAANMGSGCHEHGWKISEVNDREIVARKNGPEFRISPEDCSPPNGTPISPGMLVSVRLPKEVLNRSPGFYMALGNKQLATDDGTELIRFYWNLTPSAATPFINSATRLLNEANLPFHVKVLRDPDLYTRCDAGVIYALKNDYDGIVEVLVKVYGSTAGKLKASTPVFTKKLAPGLGLAENPHSMESFGEHRCGLLAKAMVGAQQQGLKSVTDRLAWVMAHFEREQIRIEAPFLNPLSSDEYDFPAVS